MGDAVFSTLIRSRARLEGIAILLVVLPLVVGVAVGRGFHTTRTSSDLDIASVFVQNVRLGLIVSIGGLVTFGLLAIVVLPVGFLFNGMVIGSALSERGAMDVLSLQLHAPFEIAAFVSFGAAGLQVAAGMWSRGTTDSQPSITREARRFLARVVLGLVLLSLSAYLEVLNV